MTGSVLVKTKRRLPEDLKGKAARKNLGRKNRESEKDRLIWVIETLAKVNDSKSSDNEISPAQKRTFGKLIYRSNNIWLDES